MIPDSVPSPVVRVVVFTVIAVSVYGVLLGAGVVLFPESWYAGSYRLSATIAAAGAALYLVYLGGLGKLRDLLR